MSDDTATVLVPSPMTVDLPSPIKDYTGRERVYVNPPIIHLKKEKEQLRDIHFMNNTGAPVRIWLLEAASIFVGPPEGYTTFEIPFVVQPHKPLDLKLKSGLDYFDYVYHVYCDAIGHEAEGNSPPGISCP